MYADPSPGTGKTLNVSPYTINDGAGGTNYTVTTVPNTAGVITPAPFSQFIIQVLSPALVAGTPFLFTVQAADAFGNPVTTYSGTTGVTVNTTPADPQGNLPLTSTLTTSNFAFFLANLKTAGPYTLTATIGTFTATSAITVTPSAANYFTVTAPASATTGSPFDVAVTAYDHFGNVATGYSGLVHLTSSDISASLPANAAATNGQITFHNVKLNTAGNQTITATDTVSTNPTITGTSSAITARGLVVVANSFTPSPTGFALTLSTPIDQSKLTLYGSNNSTPQDVMLFGQVGARGLSGTVGATEVGNTVTLTAASTTNFGGAFAMGKLIYVSGVSVAGYNGVFTVTSVNNTGSTKKITYTSPVAGLAAGTGGTVSANLVKGSLLVDPTGTRITFNASSALELALNGTSPVLPDSTYAAILVSGTSANGFQDLTGAALDGTNTAGHANWVSAPFTTTYQASGTEVLSLPDFARGPDGSHDIKVPNDKTGNGIPVTLYKANGVTDASFKLTYNSLIFNPMNGGTDDSTQPGSTFVMGTPSVDPVTKIGTVTFTYHNSTPASGTVILGDIIARVPDSAASAYKTKELLQTSAIAINGNPAVVSANAIHINAYFGDLVVTANPTIDSQDALAANTVAIGAGTGFDAYQLLDPAIIGDIAGGNSHLSVDATSVSDLFNVVAAIPVPQIPAIPSSVTSVSFAAADPTLSLVAGEFPLTPDPSPPSTAERGVWNVAVMLDHPHPDGSTGMTQAHLALTYDPSRLSVSAGDITLGSIPSLAGGWQLTSEVDAATGQIGISLFSASGKPITETEAGSLVKIAFHVLEGERQGVSPTWPLATGVQLVSQVIPNGRRFVTDVDDNQGPLVLTPGIDRLAIADFRSQVADLNANPQSEILNLKSQEMTTLATKMADEGVAASPVDSIEAFTIFTSGEAISWLDSHGTDFQAGRGEWDGLEIHPTTTAVGGAFAFLVAPLLPGNSWPQVADLVFQGIGRWADLFASPQNLNWLTIATRTPAEETDSFTGKIDKQPAGLAEIDKVFAALADGTDDFGDLHDQ